MANQIKKAVVNAIESLHEAGWSQRRIAVHLGVHRETVARYLRSRDKPKRAKPAISTAGNGSPAEGAKPAISTAGRFDQLTPGRQSHCARYRQCIESMLEAGLSGQRIYQDLCGDHGFEGSYESVKRFVRKLRHIQPRRFARMECLPGEEAQVDFGRGAPVLGSTGRRRGTWILRVTLSYSRKGYTEAVYRQSTESFLRCLENAFRAFGGVPLTLCIDNLKAAVNRADWYEPELHPKIEAFCRHYGTHMLPTRPYTPRHKGKVEANVKYVKNNALKGRVFEGLAGQNAHLLHWERDIADHRIHGTTRKQVQARFLEHEQGALKRLPDSLFPCFKEGRRSVHRDSYVSVQGSYYEVPQEYIGRQVWVRWDSRVVRIYNQRMEKIGMHARLQPGQFTATLGAGGGKGSIDQSMAFWQKRALRMGPHCGAWAEAILEKRGPLGMRVLYGLSGLSRKFDTRSIERACQSALRHGLYRLKDLRRLLSQAPEQDSFEFVQEHPLIRDIDEYGALLENLYPDYPEPSKKL